MTAPIPGDDGVRQEVAALVDEAVCECGHRAAAHRADGCSVTPTWQCHASCRLTPGQVAAPAIAARLAEQRDAVAEAEATFGFTSTDALRNLLPAPESAKPDEPLTRADVDRMLRQVTLDRRVSGYWRYHEERCQALSHAEAYLSSLRDSLPDHRLNHNHPVVESEGSDE